MSKSLMLCVLLLGSSCAATPVPTPVSVTVPDAPAQPRIARPLHPICDQRCRDAVDRLGRVYQVPDPQKNDGPMPW